MKTNAKSATDEGKEREGKERARARAGECQAVGSMISKGKTVDTA